MGQETRTREFVCSECDHKGLTFKVLPNYLKFYLICPTCKCEFYAIKNVVQPPFEDNTDRYSEPEIVDKALSADKFQPYIKNKDLEKYTYVKEKLISFNTTKE